MRHSTYKNQPVQRAQPPNYPQQHVGKKRLPSKKKGIGVVIFLILAIVVSYFHFQPIIQEKINEMQSLKIQYKRFTRLESAGDGYKQVILCQDGKNVVCYSKSENASYLCSLNSGKRIKKLEIRGPIDMDIGKKYVIGSITKSSVAYSMEYGEYRHIDSENFFESQKNKAFGNDKILFSSTEKVWIWSIEGFLVNEFHTDHFNSACFFGDDDSVLVGGENRIAIYNKDGLELRSVFVNGHVLKLIRLPKVEVYLVCLENKTFIYNASLQKKGEISSPMLISEVHASLDQKYLVYFKSASRKNILMYSIDRMEVIGTLGENGKHYINTGISADGKTVIGVRSDNSVIVWRIDLH